MGEPQTFPVRVTALRNLPLDLYILMDLSSSMGTVLNNVRTVSGRISESVLSLCVVICREVFNLSPDFYALKKGSHIKARCSYC